MNSLSKIHYQRCNCTGFTLAELIVASVVMSTALLGVTALFQQAMRAEKRISIAWGQNSLARPIVEALVESLESTINLPEYPSINVQSDGSKSGWLICQTPLERRRYRWYEDPAGSGLILELQVMPFSGSSPLVTGVNLDDLDLPSTWGPIKPSLIGKGITDIEVKFKPFGRTQATNWQSTWKGRAGEAIAQISITVGEQKVVKFLAPKVNGTSYTRSE